ncbi:YchJ family metal-binding protein [Bdellovibrionota bacterium FG-2]
MIKGKRVAQTAEETLRARYTAFTLQEVDFIIDSHHSKTKKDLKREEVEDWAKNSKWLGLRIVQTDKGTAQDTEGSVTFCAQFEADGKQEDHWEHALFEKEDGKWRFLDARPVHTGTYKREEPKIGRNDLCPCKSGKKFKKCCGA